MRHPIITAGAIAIITAMSACSHKEQTIGADEAARIGTEALTYADIAKAAPVGMSEADSAAFVEAFVNTWISDRLIDRVAAARIRDTEEIDRLTAQYRRNLIMWEYRRMAVNADTALALTGEDMRAYYDAHPEQMRLDEPMVRGIYIKMETSDPALPAVRRLYDSPSRDDIDRLEKVGLRGAIHYDYFRDQWIPAKQIISKIPKEIKSSDLRKGYTLELDSDGFTYLLSVSDILPAGATMPYEAAEPRIRETLDALRRSELDARLLRRLREEALGNGTLQVR